MKLRKPRIGLGKKGIRIQNIGARVGGKKAGINLSRRGVSVGGNVGGASYNSKRGCSLPIGILLVLLALSGFLLVSPLPVQSGADAALPGFNQVCQKTGKWKVCASVSQGAPAQNSKVKVYGSLTFQKVGQPGRAMQTTWHYKSTEPVCNTGVTDAQGIAKCQRKIGLASKGYRVNVDVTIDGHTVTTWFTPQ